MGRLEVTPSIAFISTKISKKDYQLQKNFRNFATLFSNPIVNRKFIKS
jgi:hypothetical protein